MINIQKGVYDNLEIEKYSFFQSLDDAKFIIAYWYGQLKSAERKYLEYSSIETEYHYIECYDILLRSLQISGTKKEIISEFVEDYFLSISDSILNSDIELIDERIINIYFIESVFFCYGYNSHKKNIDFEEKIKDIIRFIFSTTRFCKEDIDPWVFLLKFKLLKADNEYFFEDKLLKYIMDSNKSLFYLELDNQKENIFKKKNVRNSSFFLERSLGFYDLSYIEFLEGVQSFFNQMWGSG